MEDTIAAIRTPLGEGGIGIIRISGPASRDILEEIFECTGESSSVENRRLTYGRIIDKENVFTVLVKSKGPLRNPIYKFADDELMTIDENNLRRAILSRVCKYISHKYMNGINCIYLNFHRNKI